MDLGTRGIALVTYKVTKAVGYEGLSSVHGDIFLHSISNVRMVAYYSGCPRLQPSPAFLPKPLVHRLEVILPVLVHAPVRKHNDRIMDTGQVVN